MPPETSPAAQDRPIDEPTSLRGSLSLLWTRRFGTFWGASFLSNIGTWAQQVAEPWLILTLGGSSVLVGLDAFAMNAPVWGLTLVGGLLADRFDRRRVILGFQSLQMLCPATLVVLVFLGVVRPWHVIVLSIIVGLTDALSMPSFSSIVPSIVQRSKLGSAYALNSTQFNLARIVGPAIAGILMASAGALACFTINTLSYVPFIVVALWILPRRPRAVPVAGSAPVPLLSGFREILKTPVLRRGLGTSLVTSAFCAPLVTFAPVLVRDVFHGGAGRYGGALSAFGVGGVTGAIALLAVEGKLDRRRLSSVAAMAYAVVVVAVSASPSFGWVLPLLVAGGAAMTMSNTSVNTLLQSSSGDHLRGQAASLYMLAMRGGLAVGNLLSGFAVDRFGARRALLVDGLLALTLQFWLARRPRRA